MKKGIAQPPWKVIQEMCEDKIIEKFPEYGNSWAKNYWTDFWNQRIQGEVDEVKQLSGLSQEERIAELVDVINVCAMNISNLLDSKQREMIMMRLGI